MTTVRRRVTDRAYADDGPCACDDRGGVCGLHFADLPPDEKLAARARADAHRRSDLRPGRKTSRHQRTAP